MFNPLGCGITWRFWFFAAVALIAPFGMAKATGLNPAAVSYKLPKQIKWTTQANGAQTAVLFGNPSSRGLYIVLLKWPPHHMSHPHWHPNDRYITVLSGIWWVGTGKDFNPASTAPMPVGSFVTDFAKQIHYDGAKDVPVELEIVGYGPATATPAGVK